MPTPIRVLASCFAGMICACGVATARCDEPDNLPRRYVCYRAAGSESGSDRPLSIDGRLDESAWQAAPWTADFVDIEGDKKPRPRFRTRAKMLWDDRNFYVAAELSEPHVWGTLRVRDSVVFHDNDFEVFLDPDGDGHNYGEFEINALNTGWDLRLPKPYKDGGAADDGWNIAELKTAVSVRGTLNDPTDEDEAWVIEMAIPWKSLGALDQRNLPVLEAVREGSVWKGYQERNALEFPRTLPAVAGWREIPRRKGAIPPRDGDQWRLNFSRVEWRHEVVEGKYQRVANTKEDNWVWSPQGVIDMHRPETWGYAQFSTISASDAAKRPVTPKADPTAAARRALSEIYYAQREHRERHGEYSAAALDSILRRPGFPFASSVQSAFKKDEFWAGITLTLDDGSQRFVEIRQDSQFTLYEPNGK